MPREAPANLVNEKENREMAKIERCLGTDTGYGYLAGAGEYGKTQELDDIVVMVARLLKKHFDTNIQIRFNSDQKSGGAFIADHGQSSSIGITAGLANRELYKMPWEQIIEKTQAELDGYAPDFIKVSTCLDRSFLRESSDYVLCNHEYRDFNSLEEAMKWILEGTNERLWKYVQEIKQDVA